MVLQTLDQVGKIVESSPTARFVTDNTVGCRSNIIRAALIGAGVGLLVGIIGTVWYNKRNRTTNLQEPQFVVNEAIETSKIDSEIIPEIFQRPVDKPRKGKKFKVA